jgi:Sec-independent protein translocase protein TatA
MRITSLFVLLLLLGTSTSVVHAQDLAGEVAELRALLSEVQQDYEARINELEVRLARAEQATASASSDAAEAFEIAEETAIGQSAGTSAANTFNPSLGAILSGLYSNADGFELGEAEVNLNADVDDRFFGNLTVAVVEEGGEVEVELEEAWLQTTSLPGGVTLKGGRFFSGAGYLNEFHFHTDDFVDRPLPYELFFDEGRYGVDGLQARWVAPTSLLFELGGETSAGADTLFATAGGDVGASHSWQVGYSFVKSDEDALIGDGELNLVDFVWKWAPNGNTAQRSFKLQGEYFSSDLSGWYLQGVWQFMPQWRAGLRHDTVEDAERDSVMIDWSPSEYSRLRLQYINDRVLAETDHQWFLQYIMSLGAHGAHQF